LYVDCGDSVNRKPNRRPIGIDLFAGAGGLSLGFEQAGFNVVAAVEVDPVHAAVHKFNFPRCAVMPRSALDLSGRDIRRAAKIGSRKVDVVFGGAPCQGFSLIGQRAMEDPRNALVREFVRLVDELRPSCFVFENVKGLTVGTHKVFLEELIDAFARVGYCVTMPWKILNAADYGVPQDRRRLFLLGAKPDIDLPVYPAPTSRAAGKDEIGLPSGPSCADALDDLPEAEDFCELLHADCVETAAWTTPSVFARRMRCLDDDSWDFGHPRLWNRNLLSSSMRTNHTEISRRRFAGTEPGAVERISRFFRLPPHGVANTLRAGTDSARGAFTSPRPIHHARPRCVTVREMARLHGFPDWFRFNRTKWHGARQIGNAVPPPLAKAVAARVIEALGIVPERPQDSIKLGSDALLQMDVSRASSHWGVPNPIRRRDRTSGARKRKQEDIEADERLHGEFRRRTGTRTCCRGRSGPPASH